MTTGSRQGRDLSRRPERAGRSGCSRCTRSPRKVQDGRTYRARGTVAPKGASNAWILRTTLPVALTLIILPAGLSAGPKRVPTRLAEAQYVALGYDLGDRFLSESEAVADPDVMPEDRKALAEIRDKIKKWNRYVITPRPAQAELFIAVRKGRRASGAFRVPVGEPGLPSSTTKRSLVELSSPDDMLSVYETGSGMSGSRMSGKLLWREQLPRACGAYSSPNERLLMLSRKSCPLTTLGDTFVWKTPSLKGGPTREWRHGR
jgi:hypothetical protein